MKKIFYTISVLVVVLISVSCSNEDTSFKMPVEPSNSSPISFGEYYDFISVDSRDKVLISNLSFINSVGSVSSLSSVRKDITSPYLLEYDNTLFTPQYIYNSQELSTYNMQDNALSSIFGRGFVISISNDVLALSENSNYDIYIPNIIEASVSNLSVDGEVQSGTVINWNADHLNNNGVVLSAEYAPYNQSDEKIVRSFPNRIVAGISFQDNGSYTIQSNDFNALPNGAKITFTIARAGFVLTNDGNPDNDLSFGVYSSVKAEYIIKY